MTAHKVYREDFDDGPGGWVQVIDNVQPVSALTIQNGAALLYSPWWVDYNHAPPGGGYLQLLMCLYLKGPFSERVLEVGRQNKFTTHAFSRNLTNSRLTVRLKGELEMRGARLCVLIQASVAGQISGWVLSGHPIPVTEEFADQTVALLPDERLWTCLGSRHDRTEMYSSAPLATVLSDVNVNLYFVLFPVMPRPMGPPPTDPHKLRAGRDYPIWQSSIAEGYIMVDSVQIDYPSTTPARA